MHVFLTATHHRFAALLAFLRSEGAGGTVLILAAAVALVWSNSPAAESYEHLLHLPIGVSVGEVSFVASAHLWVNDALMAVFFLLVGLELRREMTEGELASPARVAAPAFAALGGMVVPALIYVAFNLGDPAALRGWAVPVATDIAFALAVLNVLGRRVPIGLKVFLTALAIIDDLGAIVVIALFYTGELDLAALAEAGVVLAALYGLSRAGVRGLLPYVLGGVVLWALVFRSGVHATLAGVALAFVVPMDRRPDEEHSPALSLIHALHGPVAFGVLPLFGLLNAGLHFGELPPGVWRDPVVLGAGFGLLVGKQIGVFGGAVLAARLGVATLPSGISAAQLYGMSILCGIGFTMSLFIGDLAFRGTPQGDEVKLAVFAASLASALLGLAVLSLASRRVAPAQGTGVPEMAVQEAGTPGTHAALTPSAAVRHPEV